MSTIFAHSGYFNEGKGGEDFLTRQHELFLQENRIRHKLLFKAEYYYMSLSMSGEDRVIKK